MNLHPWPIVIFHEKKKSRFLVLDIALNLEYIVTLDIYFWFVHNLSSGSFLSWEFSSNFLLYNPIPNVPDLIMLIVLLICPSTNISC